MQPTQKKTTPILLIYIPVLLAYSFEFNSEFSYVIAWLGSFFIFYISWVSSSKYLNTDLPISKQIMRPIFLIQLIFAGVMCCTSIFYFLNHVGYEYFTKLNPNEIFIANHQTDLIAQCQRLSLLAHAALVTGMILKTKDHLSSNYQLAGGIDSQLIKFALVVYGLSFLFKLIPGLFQFSIMFNSLAIISGAVLLVRGIVNKKLNFIIVGSAIFLTNFLAATLSGYKEPIIVNILILGCLLLPFYKKTIILFSLPILYLLFYILPTYAGIMRSQAWSGEKSAIQARAEALETLSSNESDELIDETNWEFLTDRLSEIGMFTQFVDYVPEKRNYYGFEIINNSIEALIPRVIWPNKPSIEDVSMERVYEAGVIQRGSVVSAKTRPVVDAYLSGGILGVFMIMLLYGIFVQTMSNQAEKLFGGYEFGGIIIFNSLYQSLWRGNNLEFMINNMFYSTLLLYVLFNVLKKINILIPTSDYK